MTEYLHASDYDPDLSHALLIGVLMKMGGSIDLAPGDLAPEALGDTEGKVYPLTLEPLPDGGARLSVAPTSLGRKG
ncbi:hypothetical protein [Nocardia sp. CC201C]|uniref:hypothetical protein n=1 Tax=Nocardia sp. CC201C TaxID=3044575 RepID=UPI0024A80B91|nr:hypothetical protein [Nocardia sp. CC201C]